jgi:hypothetical protein
MKNSKKDENDIAKISKNLDNIDKTLVKIFTSIDKHENPFLKWLGIGGMFVGLFGIIHVIDTIIKWIKEGI